MNYVLPAFSVGYIVGAAVTIFMKCQRARSVGKFPLSPDLSSIHNDVTEYSSRLQVALAAKKQTHSLSTDALANIHYSAIRHRSKIRMCHIISKRSRL